MQPEDIDRRWRGNVTDLAPAPPFAEVTWVGEQGGGRDHRHLDKGLDNRSMLSYSDLSVEAEHIVQTTARGLWMPTESELSAHPCTAGAMLDFESRARKNRLAHAPQKISIRETAGH
jgi:hypothetical protein